MKISRWRKIYIYLHMRYCDIFHKKFIKEYIAIYKYKNKIGYFKNVTGFSKRDCENKVRTIVFHSDFFNDLKDKKDIQVIVIENEV